MTTPIEGATTLVESILTDVRLAKWERLPPMESRGHANEVRQARGTTWCVLAVHWKQNSEDHFEAVATSKLKNSPIVVRLPASDAAAAWAAAEHQLH